MIFIDHLIEDGKIAPGLLASIQKNPNHILLFTEKSLDEIQSIIAHPHILTSRASAIINGEKLEIYSHPIVQKTAKEVQDIIREHRNKNPGLYDQSPPPFHFESALNGYTVTYTNSAEYSSTLRIIEVMRLTNKEGGITESLEFLHNDKSMSLRDKRPEEKYPPMDRIQVYMHSKFPDGYSDLRWVMWITDNEMLIPEKPTYRPIDAANNRKFEPRILLAGVFDLLPLLRDISAEADIYPRDKEIKELRETLTEQENALGNIKKIQQNPFK